MKKLFYSLFAAMFNIFRLLGIKEDLVVFLSPHNAAFTDSLGEVASVLEKDGGFELFFMAGAELSSLRGALRFFTKGACALARAKYVFMNDNFMPMSQLRFHEDTVITQLWHGEGAFKKFGLSIALPEDIRRREREGYQKLTFAVCSSEAVVPIYSEAFGLPTEKILPLGSPRCDYFFRQHDLSAMRRAFDAEHPRCVGKKLILYAPTFRDSPEKDKKLLDSFDFALFREQLGDEYELLLRLHPQVHAAAVPAEAVNVTGTKNVGELVLLCDALITDYSSICMDFTLLRKPSFFYAFDLDEYKFDRNFYFDYLGGVPGEVVFDTQSLVSAIKNARQSNERLERFRTFNFGNPDGAAAQRVVEAVIGRRAR